jgi:hypothetical protein
LSYFAGNVGIGTTNPSAKLHVQGGITVSTGNVAVDARKAFMVAGPTDTNWGMYYSDTVALNGSNACTGQNFTNALRLRSFSNADFGLLYENHNNQCLFSVRSTDGMSYFRGNMGIGKTNPASPLDVNGDIRTSGDLIFPQNDSLLAAPANGEFGSVGTRIVLWPVGSTNTPYALGMAGGTLWYGTPSDGTHRWYVGTTERMSLNTSFSVNANTAITGTLSNSSTLTTGAITCSTVTATGWVLGGNIVAGSGAGTRQFFMADNGNNSGWSFGQDTDNKFKIKGGFAGGNNFANSEVTNPSRLTIDGAGNVGIGSSSPTQKLDVNGTIKATSYSGLPVASTSTAGVVQLDNNASSTNTTTVPTFELFSALLKQVQILQCTRFKIKADGQYLKRNGNNVHWGNPSGQTYSDVVFKYVVGGGNGDWNTIRDSGDNSAFQHSHHVIEFGGGTGFRLVMETTGKFSFRSEYSYATIMRAHTVGNGVWLSTGGFGGTTLLFDIELVQ